MELDEELTNHVRAISNNSRYTLETRIRILENVVSEIGTILDMLRYEQVAEGQSGTLFEMNHD